LAVAQHHWLRGHTIHLPSSLQKLLLSLGHRLLSLGHWLLSL
jgi:hypothetical protein